MNSIQSSETIYVPVSAGRRGPLAAGGHRCSMTRIGFRAMAVAGAAALLLAAFWLHTVQMVQNHDNDWLLVAAGRWLAGGHYVTDFNEENPPLIILLMAPSAAMATWLQLEPYTVFVAQVTLLILLSALLVWPIISWLWADRPVGAALILIAYVAILTLAPGYDFGQREHLAVILACPGLFWLAAREAGRRSHWIGAPLIIISLAAIGLLIKPHFLLVPAVLLAARAVQARTWRVLADPAVCILAAAAILYGMIILLIFPDYLQQLQLKWQVYFSWHYSWFSVFGNSHDAVAALCLAGVLAVMVPMPRGRRILCGCLWLAAFAWLIIAWTQRRRWDYHFLPVIELGGLALAIALVEVLGPRESQSRDWPVRVVLAAAILAGGVFLGLPALEACSIYARHRIRDRPLIATLHDLAAGKPVLLLTSAFQPGVPSLAGVQIGARAPDQSLLPAIAALDRSDPAQSAKALQLTRLAGRQVVEDLNRYNPAIVAVDHQLLKLGLPDNFDILGVYLQDDGFREAWRDYRWVASAGGWEFYSRRP